jgi:hypothetical protein
MTKLCSLAGFLLVLILAASAFAQDTRANGSRVAVEAGEIFGFQELGRDAYRPLVIKVTASPSEADDLQISLTTYRGFDIYRKRHRLKAGETLRVEIPLYIMGGNNHFQIEVTSARQGRLLSDFMSAPNRGYGRGHGSKGEFNSLLITREHSRPETFLVGGFKIETIALSDRKGYRRWQSYSAMDTIVLQGEAIAGLHPDARAALRTWVETGGSLLAYTERPDERADLRRMFPVLPASLPEGHCGFDCGLGRIVVGPSFPFVNEENFALYHRTLQETGDPICRTDAIERHNPGARTRNFYGRGGERPTSIPGIGGVSARAFAFAILLFGILVGPVNLFVLSRMKRRVWALVTIPMLSLAAFLSIVGYAYYAEGREVQVLARSLTVLDQVQRRSVTSADLAYYTGLSPTRGLEFEGDLAVFNSPKNLYDYRADRFGVDWSEGTRAYGQWLPARATTILKTVGARSARERLEVEREGESLAVRNSLGVALRELIVADEDGRLFRGSNIAAGERSRLSELMPPRNIREILSSADDEAATQHWAQPQRSSFSTLNPRQYLTRLAAPLHTNYGTDRAAPRPGIHLLKGSY